MWDEITYPFLNYISATVEVWEWISNCIPCFLDYLITYPCWDWFIFVKWAPADKIPKSISSYGIIEISNKNFIEVSPWILWKTFNAGHFFFQFTWGQFHWNWSSHQSFNSFWPSDTIWRQRSESTVAKVMTCCLTAPSHYLNQCWLIISEVQWHSYQGSFTRDASIINH